jgi:hypothetical protein
MSKEKNMRKIANKEYSCNKQKFKKQRKNKGSIAASK